MSKPSPNTNQVLGRGVPRVDPATPTWVVDPIDGTQNPNLNPNPNPTLPQPYPSPTPTTALPPSLLLWLYIAVAEKNPQVHAPGSASKNLIFEH